MQYFLYCGVDPNLRFKNILELGRGELPAINFCENVGAKSRVVDVRSESFPFDWRPDNCDEVWVFDALSFCDDPTWVMYLLKCAANVIRFFEPLDVAPNGTRISSISLKQITEHFPRAIPFPANQKIAGFHDSACAYGIFEADFFAPPPPASLPWSAAPFEFSAAPAICISTEPSIQRREMVRAEFLKHQIKARFFCAVTPENAKPPELSSKPPRVWACAKSHAEALRHNLLGRHTYAVIFEDDVVFCDDFKARIKHIDKLCEDGFSFDFLAIGGHFDAKDYMPRETKHRHIYHLERMNGTYAYIISAAAADFFIRNWTHEYGADEFFSRFLFPAFAGRCFAFLPFLCATRPGVSTITGNYWEHESVWWHYEQKSLNLNHEE